VLSVYDLKRRKVSFAFYKSVSSKAPSLADIRRGQTSDHVLENRFFSDVYRSEEVCGQCSHRNIFFLMSKIPSRFKNFQLGQVKFIIYYFFYS